MCPAAAEIRLHPADQDQSWSDQLLADARLALETAEERLGLALSGAVTIRTHATMDAFRDVVGIRPTHVLALARPRYLEIHIPRSAWVATERAMQQQTLIHEMTHLIIGRRAAQPLPAWLGEGIAMLAARQVSYADRFRLNTAGAFGTLIPLRDLESDVLLGGERQHLAYAQSISVTRFLLDRSFAGEDGAGDLKRLAQTLADPEAGPRLRDQIYAPAFRDALDFQWRAQFASLWNWISFLSGASFLWLFTAGLFLLAYWRKRRMSRQIMERFEREEYDDGPPINIDHLLEDDDDEDFIERK